MICVLVVPNERCRLPFWIHAEYFIFLLNLLLVLGKQLHNLFDFSDFCVKRYTVFFPLHANMSLSQAVHIENVKLLYIKVLLMELRCVFVKGLLVWTVNWL